MVKLNTFLLAVTLAAGPAVASSNEYQRRSDGVTAAYRHFQAREPLNIGKAIEFGENVAEHKNTKKFLKGANYGMQIANTFQSRAFENDEDVFGRDLDAFDDLEAREPFNFGKAIEFGEKVAEHKHTKNILKGANYGMQIANTFQSRALEDDEDVFGRDLDAFDDLEAREPFNFGKAIEFGEKVAEHKHTKNILKGANYGMQVANTFQSRAFEDDEDVFGRDLGAFDDLEAREPFNFGKAIEFGEKVAEHKHTKNILKGANYGMQVANTFQSRAFEDDEDVFGRDFDAFNDL